MGDPASKRRWLRFSLKSLFILIAILGVVLGWVTYELKWIRDRHAFLDEQETAKLTEVNSNWNLAATLIIYTDAPGWLWLFGEYGQASLEVRATPSLTLPEAADRARHLFPEAEITTFQAGPNP